MHKKSGFTLIELLIVVLIIAILAAIAVPNFLEFQTRAKVSRVKSDQRNITTALEAYCVDYGEYPILRGYVLYRNGGQHNRDGIHHVLDLSTPIAYMSNVNIPDPFGEPFDRNELGNINYGQGFRAYSIGYCNIDNFYKDEQNGQENPHSIPWVLVSLGPDYVKGPNGKDGGGWSYGNYSRRAREVKDQGYQEYDPTNGTNSGGDILRWP